MVFSSLSEKSDSIRWPGEPVGRLSARAPDLRCPPCGKKNLRGGPPGRLCCLKDGPPGASGPRGSTRTTPRSRGTALRWQRVRRKAVLVRGSCQGLQLGKQKAKDPVACGLPGLLELRRPEPPDVQGSRKAIRRNSGATNPPQLCGSSIRLAGSGIASLSSRASGASRTFGRWPQCDGQHLQGRD